MNDEKAIEQLEGFLEIDDWSAVYMPYLQDAIEYAINRIKTLEDRPQGNWVKISEIGIAFTCDKCNEVSIRPSNFCPYCGADMQKGGKE